MRIISRIKSRYSPGDGKEPMEGQQFCHYFELVNRKIFVDTECDGKEDYFEDIICKLIIFFSVLYVRRHEVCNQFVV